MSERSLMSRDEITVFEVVYTNDDMMSWTETKSNRRRKLKCRMQPMSREEKQLYDIPILEEAYMAYFFQDPQLELKHMAIYQGRVFDVTSNQNLSGQGWVWEVSLQHQPGLQIDV
jgi:hypothetical protein